MAVRATHVPSGTDITIGPFIDPVSQAVIDEIYQNCSKGVLECREHDGDPRLRHLRDSDGRVHDAWVHLKKNPARTKWVIAHSATGIGREFRSHKVPVGKSAEHQWQQDYISRAAEDAGFPAEQEVILPTGTRLDVKVDGAIGAVGFEVQHSYLSVPKVRNRTRKAAAEGIPLVWSADHKGPAWAFKVPHIEANGSPFGDTPRRAWTVTTGPREIIPVRCGPQNAGLLPRCWKRRGRSWCGGWHAVFQPITGLVVDDLAQRVPAGELVPLDTNTKQGVILVPASHQELWVNEFASQVQPAERAPNRAKRCTYEPVLAAQPKQSHCVDCGELLGAKKPGWVICASCFSMPRLRDLTAEYGDSPEITRPEPATGLSAEMWGLLAPGFDH